MSAQVAADHEGGCLCGAVRYRARNLPQRCGACHCTYCQKRTGSAFGIGAYFKAEEVEMRGELRAYEHRSDETGRWLRQEFCPRCGTVVTWTLEAMPGLRAIAAGSFDDPKWLKIERHSWLRSAHRWFTPPEGVAQHEKGSLPPPK
jgi:hypothetical protein